MQEPARDDLTALGRVRDELEERRMIVVREDIGERADAERSLAAVVVLELTHQRSSRPAVLGAGQVRCTQRRPVAGPELGFGETLIERELGIDCRQHRPQALGQRLPSR